MVAALQRLLVGETGLLEQVDNHISSRKLSSGVEMNTDELPKPGAVVVPHGFGITPGLEHGVSLDNLILEGGLALLPLARGADGGKVGDDLLGVLSLSGTGLSGDEDRLVDATASHPLVGALGNGKDVWPVSVSCHPSVHPFSNLHFTLSLAVHILSGQQVNE